MQPPDQEPTENINQGYDKKLVTAEELIAPGISYPPPPEFYVQMAEVTEKKFQLPILPPKPPQPLLAAQPAWSPPASETDRLNQQRLYAPAPLPGASQQNRYSTPYRGQRVPRRRPNKWAWIMIAVLSAILLSSCGLVGWTFFNWVSPAVQQLYNGMQTVSDYYDALQAKNYTAAYQLLALEGKQSDLTQAQFMQQAQAIDKQDGSISTYSVDQPDFGSNNTDTGTNISEFTIQVNVTRGNKSYNVNLNVKLIGGSWKITAYDQL